MSIGVYNINKMENMAIGDYKQRVMKRAWSDYKTKKAHKSTRDTLRKENHGGYDSVHRGTHTKGTGRRPE